ncbi:hypothetical protein [Spiroplasma endosymbiont of Virgichneumon dumeticola]
MEKSNAFKNFNKEELFPKLIYLPAEIIFDVKDTKINNLLHKKYTLIKLIRTGISPISAMIGISAYYG